VRAAENKNSGATAIRRKAKTRRVIFMEEMLYAFVAKPCKEELP
jgi:hypothetical protein